MNKYIILAAVLAITATVASSAAANAISETYKFNELWASTQLGNTVAFTWTYSNALQTLTFGLTFPELPAAVTGIVDRVFLKANAAATTEISAFNPTRTVSGGFVHYDQTISLEDMDDKVSGSNKYPCTRTSVNATYDQQTCSGLLSFYHQQYDSADRHTNFVTSMETALVRYQFILVVNYDLQLNTIVNTVVKTKVVDLPCAACQCSNQCSQDVSFKLSSTVCTQESYNAATGACTARANNEFIFGDVGYFKFETDVKTRNLDLFQIYAYSPADSGDNFSVQIPNTYATSQRAGLGINMLSMPIAGPASQSGLAFNLKFIFRLATLADARFLENMNDRVLATGDASVTYTDVKGFQATPSTASNSVATSTTATNDVSLNQIFNLCAAILAVVALTCVLAVVSNVVPLLRKRNYDQVPTQVVKSQA